jgi:hypothetical protein
MGNGLMPAGRPTENRVKLTCYILPETMNAIESQLTDDRESNTLGKVIDQKFRRKKAEQKGGR